MLFFTSDHHFFHKNIIQYCNRPFSDIQEMHRELIKRWNDTIAPRDTVYVLGDFCFGKSTALIETAKKLNGRKILIRGNHDKQKLHALNEAFFDVHDELTINLGGKAWKLSHYPYIPDENEILAGKEYRFLEKRPKKTTPYLLHGHVHQAWKCKDDMINVGVDVWNFFPVSETQLLDEVNNVRSGRS